MTPAQPRTRHVTVRVSFWIEGRDESEAEPVDVRFHEWTECRGFYENHEWQRDEAIREAVSDWLFRRIRDEHEDYPHAKEPCAMVSARLDGSDHVRRYAVYLDHDRGAEFDATEFTDDCQEVLLDPYPPRLPRVATHERRMPSDDERRLIEQNKMLRSALRSVLDEARYLSESSANADWRKLSDRDVVQAARRLVDMDHGRSDLDPEAVVRGMADIRVGAGLALDEAGSSGGWAKAREEGAAAALHDARRTLLDLADDFTGDHAQGLRHAVRVIHDKIKAAKEAGKVGG